ncbi:DUF4265 domain-containing protein [Nocardia sp. NPDC058499]|uniref:DUF4265 domain-containing protein n=1 Tax=Nocardia sp. NPDC058499 TaxID=3346530 RepID=UPI003663B009
MHQRFAAFDLGGGSDEFPMVALTVPVGADFAGIKAALEHGQDNGWWRYEVACGADEWWNA